MDASVFLVCALAFALGASGSAWWLLQRRVRRLEADAALLQRRLEEVGARAARADEGVLVLASVLLERGTLKAHDLAAAREQLLEEPRRRAAEQDALLKDVPNREALVERMVHAGSERKH